MGIFNNQGQVCNAGSRLIVEAKIERDLVDRVVAIGKALEPRDPLDPATKLGAIVSREQLDRVVGYVEDGKSQGAHLRLGGHRVLEETGGYYMEANRLRTRRPKDADRAGGNLRTRCSRRSRFRDSTRRSPLRTTRSTDSLRGSGPTTFARRIAQRKPCARAFVWINCFDRGNMSAPFGGFKQSGFGRDKSFLAFEKYTDWKAVWIAS
jgi:gamma-glutamyl-gamma-aminobutyraldehyde dehydrogenase